MDPILIRRACALIDHIQTHFHEGHRRAVTQLLALADTAHEQGLVDAGLGDELRSLFHALEQHMFKEEMRLFPMMEQGGNVLIGQLIEDLHRDHLLQQAAMDGLRTRLHLLGQAHPSVGSIHVLTQGVEDFVEDLRKHVRAEDDDLFPLFAMPAPATAAPAVHPQLTTPAHP